MNKTMKKKLRWIMLFLSCMFVVPNYFCFDNPASLETYIEDKLDKTPYEYGFLYSVYAIPNSILPLLGGLFVDKLGVRVCLVIFSILLCLGQMVIMLGGYRNNFTLMIIGRGIFGAGCESMYVGQATIVSSWFINYELSLAIAMISCIPLCGSFLGGAIVPTIYEKNESFGEAFRIGFLLCVGGLVVVLGLVFIDYRTEKHD
jgi:MFS family permease